MPRLPAQSATPKSRQTQASKGGCLQVSQKTTTTTTVSVSSANNNSRKTSKLNTNGESTTNSSSVGYGKLVCVKKTQFEVLKKTPISDITNVKFRESKSDKSSNRRSASIAPQTVASLASQWNTLITRNQNVEGGAICTKKVTAGLKTSNSWSCPPSPYKSFLGSSSPKKNELKTVVKAGSKTETNSPVKSCLRESDNDDVFEVDLKLCSVKQFIKQYELIDQKAGGGSPKLKPKAAATFQRSNSTATCQQQKSTKTSAKKVEFCTNGVELRCQGTKGHNAAKRCSMTEKNVEYKQRVVSATKQENGSVQTNQQKLVTNRSFLWSESSQSKPDDATCEKGERSDSSTDYEEEPYLYDDADAINKELCPDKKVDMEQKYESLKNDVSSLHEVLRYVMETLPPGAGGGGGAGTKQKQSSVSSQEDLVWVDMSDAENQGKVRTKTGSLPVDLRNAKVRFSRFRRSLPHRQRQSKLARNSRAYKNDEECENDGDDNDGDRSNSDDYEGLYESIDDWVEQHRGDDSSMDGGASTTGERCDSAMSLPCGDHKNKPESTKSKSIFYVNEDESLITKQGIKALIRKGAIIKGRKKIVAVGERPKDAPPAPPGEEKPPVPPVRRVSRSNSGASDTSGVFNSQFRVNENCTTDRLKRAHSIDSNGSDCPIRDPVGIKMAFRGELCEEGADLNGEKTYLSVEDWLEYQENHPFDASKLSPFDDEPLYQFYNMASQERAVAENRSTGSSEEDYCYSATNSSASVRSEQSVDSNKIAEDAKTTSRFAFKQSAMDLVANGASTASVRTLWCELPEVIQSGILKVLNPQQKKLQEAMFEVITSEASYLKSLNVLARHFIACPQLSGKESILTVREHHNLFSDVQPVRDVSEKLLADLEKRWQAGLVISEICDVIYEHASRHFNVYVKYCSNQVYQDRTLKELKSSNAQFSDVLQKLESSPVCQGLAMHSFLILPMQRITRMPLLIDAIYSRLEYATEQFDRCKATLALLNKIVQECNEGAHRMERMEEMLLLSNQLTFKDVRSVPLISPTRWLVKRGDMLRLLSPTSNEKISTFGRKSAKQPLHLFLFTDLLIFSKRKGDTGFTVQDYCPRNMIQAIELGAESTEKMQVKLPDDAKNAFMLTLLHNHEGKTVEYVVSTALDSERTRWMEAVTPKTSTNPEERIYEEWDCPQVQATHLYTALQTDELTLEKSDVVNVFRKTNDGWAEGERLRDGSRGWFPLNHTKDIMNDHVRARNLRQRYRLLAASYNFIEEKRREKKESSQPMSAKS